jgi:Zn-dependent protease with chaperone function
MALTQAQLESLVAGLEDEADRNPGAYRLKLGAFAALAYVYIFGLPALLVGVGGALGYAVAALAGGAALVGIAIPAAVLFAVVFAGSRIRLDSPTGLEMKPAERRRLFAVIDEAREAAKARPVHVVQLTRDLAAAVVQVPRLGPFGWQRNHLTLGLPLMQLLTLDELKAVLVHELAHLSSSGGRFGAWIYRNRDVWIRLNERLQGRIGWSRILFAPFFGWLAPRFAAYSFVEARHQEYEADGVAAAAVGAAALTNALIRLDLKERELKQHFWPRVYARTADEPSPTASPFSDLAARERREFPADAPDQLKQALIRPTDTTDTHPCLSERVAAIRQPARLPPPATGESAAEALFGGALKFIVEHFDDEWRQTVSPWWTKQHQEIKSGRARLASFSARKPEQLPDDELSAFARLTEELEGPDRAYPLYLSLAKRPSRPLGARFAVGRLLLQREDQRGKQVIDRIIAESPEAVIPACEFMIRYLRSKGREREAKPYLDRYWQKRNAEAGAAGQDEIRHTRTG